MNIAADHAREAYLAGALLALGIQKTKLLTSEELRDVRAYVRDSLRKMGVPPDLFDLNQFKTLTPDEAVNVVIDMKSSLETAIVEACGDFTGGLFLLTFDFVLVSTSPENVSEVESRLLRRAVELGFEKGAFADILARLGTEPDTAVAEYQESAEILISKRTGQSELTALDAVELKVGVGGLKVDLKLLWALVKPYFRRRQGS